jgi:hypothetical protein
MMPPAHTPGTFRKGRLLLLLTISLLWTGAVGYGFVVLQKYEATAGQAGEAPSRWPGGSEIDFHGGQANLVMVLHPHCPCSRASIEELAQIMTRCQGRLNCHVFFVKPTQFPCGWERTDLWQQAAAIPGVTVSCDEAGVEARRFGAATSGQVLLYKPDGQLIFSGGITLARGHEGDNGGREAVIGFLTEGRGVSCTPVFGCPLFDPLAPDEEVRQ